MSASQPSRFAPSPSQSRPRNEFVFEPLLDSDEAAELLAFIRKRYSAWLGIDRFTESRSGNYGGSAPLT
jgi:hypothetical protein